MKFQLLVVLLALMVFGCSTKEEKSDAYGNFETDPVIVSSETAGKIISLNIEKGQKLEAGYVAALVDTVQTELKVQQILAQMDAVNSRRQGIQAQIAVFEEQIKSLEINKKRVAEMLNDGAATQKQLDDITGQMDVIGKQISSTKTQFTSVTKEIQVLETQLASTRDQLNRCKVLSPATGTVLETYIEAGELTTPGKPLFKLANLDELTLKVYISGTQLPEVKIGQEVSVLIDKDKNRFETLSGTVSWISPEAEFTPKIIQTKEERVKLVYAVKVAVKNDGTLKIGMPGEVRW